MLLGDDLFGDGGNRAEIESCGETQTIARISPRARPGIDARGNHRDCDREGGRNPSVHQPLPSLDDLPDELTFVADELTFVDCNADVHTAFPGLDDPK